MKTIYFYIGETARPETPLAGYGVEVSLTKDDALLGENGFGSCVEVGVSDELFDMLRLLGETSMGDGGEPLIDQISRLVTVGFRTGVGCTHREMQRSLGLRGF